jgi:hypothetical protein
MKFSSKFLYVIPLDIKIKSDRIFLKSVGKEKRPAEGSFILYTQPEALEGCFSGQCQKEKEIYLAEVTSEFFEALTKS